MGRGGGGGGGGGTRMKKNKKQARNISRHGHHDSSHSSAHPSPGTTTNTKKNIVRRTHSQQHPQTPSSASASGVRQSGAQSLSRPSPSDASVGADYSQRRRKIGVPFRRDDHVLLVGEGDFSFALSLAEHHQVKHITATCYDSEATLYEKYPQARSTLQRFLGETISNTYPTPAILAAPSGDDEHESDESDSSWRGFSPSPSTTNALKKSEPTHHDDKPPREDRAVYFSISATSLSHPSPRGHAKTLRRHTPFTKIVFNFPHVGGLSTDVNRQVRANQELLVGFFKAAIPLLASEERPAKRDVKRSVDEKKRENGPGIGDERDDRSAYNTDDEEEYDEDFDTNGRQSSEHRDSPPEHQNGQILVSVFEGEPYTLWNIRDLARHCGLAVVTSFRFPWDQYPEYRHARTLGQVRTSSARHKMDESDDDDQEEEEEEVAEEEENNHSETLSKRKRDPLHHQTETKNPPTSSLNRNGKRKKRPAWKGEEREARCFVLEVKKRDDGAQMIINSAGTGGNTEPLGNAERRNGPMKNKRKRGSESESSDSDR